MRRIAIVVLAAAAGCAGDGADTGACLEPGAVCEIAGTGARGFNGDRLGALETDLNLVSRARRGPDGRLWVVDFNNNLVRVEDDDDHLAIVAGVTIDGVGVHAISDAGEPGTESSLALPMDLDFLPSGEPVLISLHDPRVLRIAADGTLQLIAGTGTEGDDGDGGPAIDARFSELAGVAVGPDGAIYVVDTKASRVRVIRDGRVFAFAGTGEAAYAGDGGPATAASLQLPTGIAVSPDGVVFIADARNHAIRRVDPDGTISTIAGTGAAGFSGDGGAAAEATLDGPDGLALADDGTLFVADRNNARIRTIDPAGTIATLAGSGRVGHATGDDPLEADFGLVARLSWSPGVLVIADQSNNCARVLRLAEP
jgi:DNA-binding beta-propeller fold protein YncE